MITNLKIQNFTLIDSLDIDFQRGFSVITGETGAGKSIILGALGMLLGQRADASRVKAGAQRCVVEAHFDLEGYDMQTLFDDNELDYDEHDCIIRREVSAAGKSRAFINDTPVNLSVLKELGERLVDIHSQHQNLLIRDAGFQLSVVDVIADDADRLEQYRKAYAEYRKALHRLDEMREQMTADQSNEDFLRFQFDELRDANLSDPDEQDELEERAKVMEHTEDIKSSLYEASGAFSDDNMGALRQLRIAKHGMERISQVFAPADELSQRLDSALIELQDIASEVDQQLERVDFDPEELQIINDRLDLFNSLERKHHAENLQQLISLRDRLSHQLSLIDNSDEAIREQEQLVAKLQASAMKIAEELSKVRRKAATKVEKEMKAHLVALGMPNVRFETSITRTDLRSDGVDDVQFLFSANSGADLKPVAQIASGGEIARVMLSLKALVSEAVALPTIIFDEIDTGVSGRIAESMARIMQQMGSAGRQVISITHLPQIAAMGTSHYKVAKHDVAGITTTQMTVLTPEERINEIAQMLSGSTISDAAILQAKELLG